MQCMSPLYKTPSMRNRLFCIAFLILVAESCKNKNIHQQINTNAYYNQLHETHELKEAGQLSFQLDSITAPKIPYVQLIKSNSGEDTLAFINKHNRVIYFYTYDSKSPIKTIKIGGNLSNNEKIDPACLYVDSNNTIYVYNRRNIELLKLNGEGNILSRISLIDGNNIRQTRWYLKYPQYYPQGSNPMIKINGQLLFPGQSFQSLDDTLIHQFRFTAYINEATNKVQFYHEYPDSLYGHNINWSGEKFTEAYADWNPNTQKLIFSFPVSHQLYTARLESHNYEAVNGASNQSASISSFPVEISKMQVKELTRHILETDEYGPIRYDPYRNVYYRFLRHAIKRTFSPGQWNDKELSIIILDKDFNYLGEKNIGSMRNWYIQNAFVNEKGLHIEHIPAVLNEDLLIYKIFTLNKKS